MAQCDIQSLLNDGACLFELSEAELRTVQFAAIKAWALSENPGLDVSLDTLLSNGACLMQLSDTALRMVIFNTLCAIQLRG